MLPPKIQKKWTKGLITRIEKESVPDASDSLNWHFLGDHIELRRGQRRLGALVEDTSPGTFVKVGRKYNDEQVLFWGYGRKFLYYNEATELNVEIGSDVLPASASGEDISATPYQSFAGSILYLSSPNSSIYKIFVANPGSVVDQQMDTFKGYIKSTLNRMFLWNRKDKYGGSDQSGLYISTIDKDSLADYPFVSAENLGTGNGSTTLYSGTLAFKASAPKKTTHFVRIAGAYGSLKSISAITQASAAQVTANTHGFAVGDVVVFQSISGMTQLNNRIAVVASIVDTNNFTIDIDTTGFTAYSSGGSVAQAELFTDDRSGGLSGNRGGTGTINYATGAYSVTFNANVTNSASIVADYYTEDATDADSGVSNSGATLDFSEGSGESIADSLYFPQADAGIFRNFGPIGSTLYCLHSLKTYALRLISSDDITNLIFRDKVGTPNWRASFATGDGIYYLDSADPKDPALRLLQIANNLAEVIPKSKSENLILTNYRFDKAVVFEWGEYIILACRTFDSEVNNRLFMLNTIWDTWEVHSFFATDLDSYNGALVAADSLGASVFKLFSGVADQDSTIENYFITGNDDYDLPGIKDIRRVKIMGLIGDDQQLDISYSVDNEPFVFVRSILGSGDYVDKSQRKIVGNTTLGETQLGGGQSSDDAIWASPYELEFQVNTKRFSRIRWKYEAKEVGYVSISEFGPVDWRSKGRRLPIKYLE